ncbi:MAG TPA: hypothetical protein VF584_12110 [Longimicrobium sp.]|jgi:hypothetical protein
MSELGANTVLLFYKDYETDRFIRGDRYLKRLVRPLYDRLHRRKKVTGFAVTYQLMVRALREQGYDVRSNDYRTARKHPEHPVGLFGFSHILDGWDLPNPRVLGVGMYDHPRLAPDLMKDPRNRFYLVPSEWVRRMFEPFYGDRCGVWHAGIDLAEWPDTRPYEKTVDVLVYDKIHWDRERLEPELLHPILARLERDGLRTEVLRYGGHDRAGYRAALGRARCMIFLGEHETMGLAYQEALASNLPILAWDIGFWQDPQRAEHDLGSVPATSVPYFSDECGDRFRGPHDFPEAFDRFWPRLASYEPRRFIAREMTLEKSAQLYMSYYSQAF